MDVLPKEIDRETLRTLVRRGAQLVEVLSREEYDRVHLTGATSVPLSTINRKTADRLQWDKPVIVYSANSLDDTSARAAWRLTSLGFTQVYRYTQGKADWLAFGLPVEGSESRMEGAGDLANMDVPTCKRGDRVGEVRERVNKDGWEHCVVVNDQLIVLGLMRKNDLEKANQRWTVEEAMDGNPKTFRVDGPVEGLNDYLKANLVDSVLVTTPDGKLFGIIRQVELDAPKTEQ